MYGTLIMNWRKTLASEDVAPGFIPTNKGHMTPDDIVSDLTYMSYAHNRDISPDITPERWARIFGEELTQRMERRYQQEKVLRTEASLQEDDLNNVKDAEYIEINISSGKDEFSGEYVPVSTLMKFRVSKNGRWMYLHDCDAGEQGGLATYIPESVQKILEIFGLEKAKPDPVSSGLKFSVQDNQTREYIVTGPEDQLDELEQMLWTIEHLSAVGASRSFEVAVDGDGAASIGVARKDGVDLCELDKSEREDGELDNLRFSIGY
jgi:hypothetical protein